MRMGEMKSIFVICPVRGLNPNEKQVIEDHVKAMEEKGYSVHLPFRDTNQCDLTGGWNICNQNKKAMQDADEVHIYWNPNSTGSLFDLGMAFMADKPIYLINTVKSFDIFIHHWSQQ
jgi:nucleoside 2-deoxyribosyltransferase